MFGSAGSALLGFLLSVMIGRGLGPEGLGIYSAALAWVFPISLLAEFGIGTLTTRAVAADPTLAPAYLRASASARILISGALGLLLYISAPLLTQDALLIDGIHLAAPLVLIQPFFASFSAIFRAQERMTLVAGLNLGMLIAQVTLTLLALGAGADVLILLAINTLTSIGQLIAALFFYRREQKRKTNDRLRLSDLLRQAAPFAIAAVLGALHLRASILVLEATAPIGEVGSYAAASRFVEAGLLLSRAFFDALFPLLAALAANQLMLRRRFRQISAGMATAGILAGFILTISAPILIELSFGPGFDAAATVLQIAGWALLPALLKGTTILHAFAQGREGWVNTTTFIALILRLILSLWLIPAGGAAAAALVNVIVEWISWGLLLLRRR